MRVLRIIRTEDRVVSSPHESFQFTVLAVHVVLEDFKHVFFCVGGCTSRTHAVLRDEKLLVVVEHLEDHVWWGDVDDGRGNDLVPGVGGLVWLVEVVGG